MYITMNNVTKQTGLTEKQIRKLVRDDLLNAVKQSDGSLIFNQGAIDEAQENGLLPIKK